MNLSKAVVNGTQIFPQAGGGSVTAIHVPIQGEWRSVAKERSEESTPRSVSSNSCSIDMTAKAKQARMFFL